MKYAGLFRSWKEAKIQKDETIMEQMNLIAKPYGYSIEEGFGIYIKKERKNHYEQKYAEVAYSGFEFSISTVSSHWDVSEATIFMKQLKEATECAAELNTYLASLERPLKKEFEKEMAEKEEEAKAE